MGTSAGATVRNWDGIVVSHPRVVVQPRTVEEIVAVMRDPVRYPAPVRVVGSNFSITPCAAANQGTLIDMSAMRRIVEIRSDAVTVEAGALYVDVAHVLQQHGLQFYVNLEMGNLSMGAAASAGTKDSAMPGEYAHVTSYAIAMKVVTPAGEILEVGEDQPELMQILRSSYGLLGVIAEVTFRIRPTRPLAVRHKAFKIEEFERRLPQLTAGSESMMYFIFPHRNSITVEFRRYHAASGAPNHLPWQLRNMFWKLVPIVGNVAGRLVPSREARYAIARLVDALVEFTLQAVIRGSNTVPADQIIRHPDKPGLQDYTFGIWAFPEESYGRTLREYCAFCRDYYQKYGFRVNMPNVGYRLTKDSTALFSYAYNGSVMTIDPVTTPQKGWEDFLKAYNEFCSAHGGTPLFNQTRFITPEQVRKAFGDRLDQFEAYRRKFDPTNRMLNDYFGQFFGNQAAQPQAAGDTVAITRTEPSVEA